MVVTPGRLGELVRIRWIVRETGKAFEDVAPLVLADRAAELAGVAIVIALSVALSGLAASLIWPLVIAAITIGWVVTRPRIALWILQLQWRATGRFGRVFVRLRAAARGLERFSSSVVLLPAIILSSIGWFIEGLAFYFFLLHLLDASVGLFEASAIFLTAVLSDALSGLPGGLGGTEAAAVTLLLLVDVPVDTALLATLTIRVRTLWFALLLGYLVFPFAESAAARAQARLK